jgi:cytosine/adenosine deaminase-related metal-dependent hydrolase
LSAQTVIEGCAIATVDRDRREIADGHLVFDDGRIAAVGPGRAPASADVPHRLDGRGLLATPAFVNCHHHFYQSATRGFAQQATLFEWLATLYPVWARIDEATVAAAARAALAALASSGCGTTTDHHYIFPPGGGDPLAVEVEAAGQIGLRFLPCRGSMDLGQRDGGLPPDDVVEDRAAILDACAAAIDKHHDPAPGAMVRVALAPASPFSVTRALLAETAELARARDVRLHTHLAETLDEEAFCIGRYGVRPLEYLDDLGWLGEDVWLAHCVHLNQHETARMAQTGTGVAHCPTSNARLGAGIAPVRDLLDAGTSVGLGVDGAASNESGELTGDLRGALLAARMRGGPRALTAREALELATLHGARCLGWEDELGHLTIGALADVALWRLDDAAHAGIADPVAALVLGPPRPVEHLFVHGRVVVADGALQTADPAGVAADLARESNRLIARYS